MIDSRGWAVGSLWLLAASSLGIVLSCGGGGAGGQADAGSHDALVDGVQDLAPRDQAPADDGASPQDAAGDTAVQEDAAQEDAGQQDAGCTPGSSSTGVVTITSGRTAVNGLTELAAVFYPAPSRYAPTCTTQAFGPSCTTVHCPGDPWPTAPPYANPGTLSISGGLVNFTVDPDTDGRYAYAADGRLWSGGEQITVSAPDLDSEYPVGRSATAPLPEIHTGLPIFTDISFPFPVGFGGDLKFDWATTPGAEIRVEFKQSLPAGGINVLTCGFPGSAGTGTVPLTALTSLDPSVQGTLDVVARRATRQTRPGICGAVSSFELALQSWLWTNSGFARERPFVVRQGSGCIAPKVLTLTPEVPSGDLVAVDSFWLRSGGAYGWNAPISPPPTACTPAAGTGVGVWYAVDLPGGTAHDVTVQVFTTGLQGVTIRSSPWDAHAAIVDGDCLTTGSCGTTAGTSTMLTKTAATGRMLFFVQELEASGSEYLTVMVTAKPTI